MEVAQDKAFSSNFWNRTNATPRCQSKHIGQASTKPQKQGSSENELFGYSQKPQRSHNAQ